MGNTINIKWLVILTILTFILLTILSGSFSGASDGLTRLGFPVVFMQDTGGKCTDCSTLKWFKWGYLIVDIAFAAGVSFGLMSIYGYLKRAK